MARDMLARYIHEKFPSLLIFYAEHVWPAIAATPGRNALGMEAQLAALADVVIIVVESPGTFAELGAFALSDELRKKLMPIVDRCYRDANSFINTGPLRWIEQESDFQPTIWVSLDRILQAASQVEARLGQLEPQNQVLVRHLAKSSKHLLFFVCDVISIIGPCEVQMIEAIVAAVLEEEPVMDVASLVSLAKAMDLIAEVQHGGCVYYFRLLDDNKQLRAFHKNGFMSIPDMRLSAMDVLQRIAEAREVLEAMSTP